MVAPDFEVVRTFPRLEEHASRLRRSVYYMYMYGFYRKRVLEAAQALYVVGADSRARGLDEQARACRVVFVARSELGSVARVPERAVACV